VFAIDARRRPPGCGAGQHISYAETAIVRLAPIGRSAVGSREVVPDCSSAPCQVAESAAACAQLDGSSGQAHGFSS